jgi:hypothetical protein
MHVNDFRGYSADSVAYSDSLTFSYQCKEAMFKAKLARNVVKIRPLKNLKDMV